ncbi:MAG: NAD-dependent epimerase/dehydratase [Promethearchaeota archaeon CR_4]|nr:MAG: NAD-dependent epimerase/dehydratase [Candidatus Lokiarchaeota archaeon CR_4]
MRVCVTGGTGFIGSHVVDHLVEWGNQVFIIDNLISSTTEFVEPLIKTKKVTFLKGDIRNRDFLLANLKELDLIIHMAADPDVKNSVPFPIESFEINVVGTLNILEAMRKNDIPRIAFASSGGTLYGQVDEFPITERAILHPISPYGASKAAGEMYISAYTDAYGFKGVSLRYANIFGPRSNHGVTYDFFNKLKANPKKLEILGDGKQQKDYLFISDCVDASLLCVEKIDTQQGSYDFYNLGADGWHTVNEVANAVIDAMHLSGVEFTYTGGSKGWVGDVAKMILDISKLKTLGWFPKVSFKEGIARYITWLEGYLKNA